MPTDVQIDWNRKIKEQQRLEHGEGAAWFRQFRDHHFPDKSVKAVKAKFYRELRKRKGKQKKSPKQADPRKREIARMVMKMKERGKQRSDSPRELATWRCLRILERRGVIKKGEISAAHVNTILREEFAYREETPRVRWEVDRSMAEVQTDGSISKFWRPWKQSEDGKDMLLKQSGRPLRYKGRNKDATKLILWQYQDKFSRLRIVRGFPGKAENTGHVLAAMHFWLNRPEDEHPMRHLPWSFGHDNGSVFRTDEWENILRSFDLDPEDTEENRSSQPYEKTGIGSVEVMWKTIWQFELELSEDYDQIWLSEYNMLLHERMKEEMELDHPVFAGKRGDLYQQSLLRQEPRPRVLKADVFSLARKRYERKVTKELNISINGTKYAVPQHWAGINTMGEYVEAWENWRGELVAELRDQYCEETFALEPFAYQMKGEFKSHKRTTQQRIKDEISSGDSMYEAVMSGRMTINEDGEYVDEETGEVLEAEDTGKPKRLMPADREHKPETPFGRSDGGRATEGREEFATVYDARVWIGKQLKGYGITYEDVKGYFDPKLEHEFELDKELIAEAVNELVDEFNAKSLAG